MVYGTYARNNAVVKARFLATLTASTQRDLPHVRDRWVQRDDDIARLVPGFDAPVRLSRLVHGKASIDDGFQASRPRSAL